MVWSQQLKRCEKICGLICDLVSKERAGFGLRQWTEQKFFKTKCVKNCKLNYVKKLLLLENISAFRGQWAQLSSKFWERNSKTACQIRLSNWFYDIEIHRGQSDNSRKKIMIFEWKFFLIGWWPEEFRF